MMKPKIPILKLVVFGTFLFCGLWMATTIHDPFYDSDPSEPNFTLSDSPAEQYRLLLVVVDNISAKPVLQSVWWIDNRRDIPTAMILLYPNAIKQTKRDDDIFNTFQLSGIWGKLKPDEEFFDLLNEWDIHWNDYLVIDLTVQSALIDRTGWVAYDEQSLNGEEGTQNVKNLVSSRDQQTYQFRIWSTLCSFASRNPEGLRLDALPLNLKNHLLTSLRSSEEGTLEIFPYQPSFPVCMVNAGFMEAAVPPFLPAK
jgi:hypothetical protein